MRRPNPLGGLTAAILSILVVSVGLVAYSAYLHTSFKSLIGTWSGYVEEETTIAVEASALMEAAGYGGFIHNLKNFALHRDPAYLETTIADLHGIENTIARLREYDSDQSLAPQLDAIERTFDEYRARLTVLRNAGPNLAAREIYELVQVDDGPALAAIRSLNQLLGQGKKTFLAESGRQFNAVQGAFLLGVPVLAGILILGLVLARMIVRLERASAALSRSYHQVDHMLEEAPDAVLSVNESGIIIRANNKVTSLLGYEPSELVGRAVDSLVPRNVRARHASYRKTYAAHPGNRPMGKAANLHVVTKQGTEIPVDIALSSVPHASGMITMVSLRDATVQRDQIAKLEEAKVHAEQLAELKSAFLANMSHEIRTPLTGILGIGHLLDASDLNARQHSLVHSLKCSGEHLLSLLNDILDLSKLEAGLLQPNSDPIDLQATADGLSSFFVPMATDKGIEFSVNVYEPTYSQCALGDEVRIRQILFNLCSNAIKFTESGSVSVDLSIDPAPSSTGRILSIRVKDTGIGISQEAMANVFDPFVQVDTNRNRSSGGSGLGLSICMRLAKAMGGEIEATSEVGQGSTFTVTLPLAQGERRESRPVSDTTVQSANHDLRILIVDDNMINRELIHDILNGMGFHALDSAVDGHEALAKILANDYDAVLLDMRMPGLDGMEVMRRLKAEAPEKAHNIIAFTADTMGDFDGDYRACGFASLVTKPVDWRALRKALLVDAAG